MTPDATERRARALLDGATPGPWRVEHGRTYDTSTGAVASVESFVRRPDDDVAIAAEIVDPATGLHSDANAALIAAAPDLARDVLSLADALRAAEARAVVAEAQRDAIDRMYIAVGAAMGVDHEGDIPEALHALISARDQDAAIIATLSDSRAAALADRDVAERERDGAKARGDAMAAAVVDGRAAADADDAAAFVAAEARIDALLRGAPAGVVGVEVV